MAADSIIREIEQASLKKQVPQFRTGDTVKVHARIVEGSKERIQVFEGVVIKRSKGSGHSNSTFTVRKISYNIGVERTFLVHSPRIDKIEVVKQGSVRRARLFYLRPLRGKAARIKTKLFGARAGDEEITQEEAIEVAAEQQASEQEATEATEATVQEDTVQEDTVQEDTAQEDTAQEDVKVEEAAAEETSKEETKTEE